MKRKSLYPPVLWNTAFRYLSQNRWFSILMVLGIAIGVGVVVAIDIANRSAQNSFELSKQVLTGKATHQIIGGPQGVENRCIPGLSFHHSILPWRLLWKRRSHRRALKTNLSACWG